MVMVQQPTYLIIVGVLVVTIIKSSLWIFSKRDATGRLDSLSLIE